MNRCSEQSARIWFMSSSASSLVQGSIGISILCVYVCLYVCEFEWMCVSMCACMCACMCLYVHARVDCLLTAQLAPSKKFRVCMCGYVCMYVCLYMTGFARGSSVDSAAGAVYRINSLIYQILDDKNSSKQAINQA